MNNYNHKILLYREYCKNVLHNTQITLATFHVIRAPNS